ncbi:unnamed protein product [Pleuronectes platessa]|uniref:Uncharacterized protein n=1 Tax=Pleuronectes platessa TaxID=8262 RepID=A0A9N7VTW5_PLEPL|nr:unnamed protein product [Pleuronectes platessa]
MLYSPAQALEVSAPSRMVLMVIWRPLWREMGHETFQAPTVPTKSTTASFPFQREKMDGPYTSVHRGKGTLSETIQQQRGERASREDALNLMSRCFGGFQAKPSGGLLLASF